jgi:hypothetical protein
MRHAPIWIAASLALVLGVRTAAAGGCPCDADINNDGLVNIIDLGILAGCLQNPGGSFCGDADVNCDGEINFCDINALQCRAGGGGVECCTCGACCLDEHTCANTTETLCAQAGGLFQGEGTVCPVANAAVIDEPDAQGNTFVHKVGPDVECPGSGGSPARGGCPPGGLPLDPWISGGEDGSMCHSFSTTSSPPIPADFFAPGSLPFSGQICFQGEPLIHDPNFPTADTIIERSGDPFDRCSLTQSSPQVVTTEIIALSLVSVAPITVGGSGGPTQWDVAVDLSAVTPPPGQIIAFRQHCNGGTYTSTINVQPRFTFTNVGNPSDVRVLDTGLTGRPFITLSPGATHEWAFDVDPGTATGANFCTDFHPGFETEPLLRVTSCDCNGNLIRDKCDIESGFSQDCNTNGFPDDCDIASGRSTDENDNGVPDECDAATPVVVSDLAPRTLVLHPARPTPMTGQTTLSYTMVEPAVVILTIHDVRGRLVRTLEGTVRSAGDHAVVWDGRNEEGAPAAPGVYYAKLQAGSEFRSTRVVVRR